MTHYLKGYLKLLTIIFISLLLFCSIFQSETYAKIKIPFKTTKVVILDVMLKDKNNDPVKAKVTLWEYRPPFKVNQTFGLKWEDLDFSTVEQVYLGFALFQSKEQYLNLYYGKIKEMMEKHYNKAGEFENMVRKKAEQSLNENYNEFHSKLLIETGGKKYIMAKRIYNYAEKNIENKIEGVKTYFYTSNGWRDSGEVVNDFSAELFTACQDKDSSQFIQWLKERQIKEENGPIMKRILVVGLIGIILIVIFFIIIRKILRIKAI